MAAIQSIFDIIGELKRKPRTGWVDHEIASPETVWEHSLALRAISRELATKYLGPTHADHCGKLAAIHDIIESIVPDITPSMGISTAQKLELETLAIDHIGTLSAGGQKIRSLWLEFESGNTSDALFVKKIDKLHVAFVALRYEQMDVCRYSLQPFWDYAKKHVADTPLVEVWETLSRQRPDNAALKPALGRRPQPPGTFELMKSQLMLKIGASPSQT